MKRREFIKVIAGSAVLWPRAAKAQQPTIPLIGFSSSTSENTAVEQQKKIHSGLGEAGFVEGKNVAIEYHWADGQYDRLPAMAADLAVVRYPSLSPRGLRPPWPPGRRLRPSQLCLLSASILSPAG